MAKNIVASGLASEVLVQVAYAIGVAEPMNLYVNTYGTAKVNLSDGEIAKRIKESGLFDMRPKAIEDRLKLRNPIYEDTASYGHVGRTPEIKLKKFIDNNGNEIEKEVELFTWEKTDKKEEIRKLFF